MTICPATFIPTRLRGWSEQLSSLSQ